MTIRYDSKKGMFEVYRKTTDGKQHFGYYHSQEAANKIVILLKKVEWKYSNLSNSAKKFFQNKGLNEFPIMKKRQKSQRKKKYYYYNKVSGKYAVQRRIGDKQILFGTFENEQEAKDYVELLKKNNWDSKYIKRKQHKHYSFQQGKYTVTKYIKGKLIVFGRYETEDEAKKAVKYFQEHDWDTNFIKRKKPKYYTLNAGSYVISRRIGDKQVYFGRVFFEEDAKKVVADLTKNDWDVEKISDESKKLLGQRRIGNAWNYSYNSKRDVYCIQKNVGSKQLFIGYVKNEEDALILVDELDTIGWDREKLSPESKSLLLNKFREEPTYYSITPDGTYRITKYIDGVNTYFGVYDTKEEAERMVELLKQNHWDRSKLPREFKEYRRNKNYYFRKDINKYTIDKKIGGENKYFGVYDTEEEAQRMVEELDKVNWIIEDLPQEFRIIKNERKKAKYYVYDNHAGKWRINKTVNGVYTNFGYYNTEEEAKKMVEFLKENNWDRSLLDIGNFKYYHKYGDKYQIKKRVEGKMKYFGTYDSEEQAQEAVQLLKENNWNKECLI